MTGASFIYHHIKEDDAIFTTACFVLSFQLGMPCGGELSASKNDCAREGGGGKMYRLLCKNYRVVMKAFTVPSSYEKDAVGGWWPRLRGSKK